jgi:hypothetical protein
LFKLRSTKAYEREFAALMSEVRRRIAAVQESEALWDFHDWLYQERKALGEKYDYRYSRLPLFFAWVIREGWLALSDLAGLGEDKLNEITKLLNWQTELSEQNS